MRFLATTGYYGSGSSAITDLVNEYSSVLQPKGTNFELSFFFGYHGILNLYNWIIKERYCQKEAIVDFMHDAERKACLGTKMNYEKYFDGHFMECTREYIRKIQGTELGMYYYRDFMRMPWLNVCIYRILNKLYSVGNVMYNRTHSDVREKTIKLFGKREMRYLYEISEKDFINESKMYLASLFENLDIKHDIVMGDGLIGTFNLDDISLFFDDIRIAIVDRDPRDIYLTEKYVYKSGSIPGELESFCNWFKTRHHMYTYNNCSVINIRFEDMIYKYDKTISELEAFFGLSPLNHVDKGHFFIPEKSRNNTRLWKKYTGEDENMEYIKRALSDWIYPY